MQSSAVRTVQPGAVLNTRSGRGLRPSAELTPRTTNVQRGDARQCLPSSNKQPPNGAAAAGPAQSESKRNEDVWPPPPENRGSAGDPPDAQEVIE